MKTLMLLMVIVVLWTHAGAGEQGNFYWWPEEEVGGLMSNRFGELALKGWVMQGVWVTNKMVGSPPGTNEPWYVSDGDVDVRSGGRGTGDVWAVGYDNVAFETWCDDVNEHGHTNADGRGTYRVFSPRASRGYVRLYSGWTVTGAAYYAQTATRLLTEPDPTDYMVEMGTWKVNPAYVLGFAWGPTNGADDLVATGVVWGVGIGLNEYAGGSSGIVHVRYRLEGEEAWQEGGKVGAGGEFTISVTESGMYEIQAYAESEVEGLPCSRIESVELVPEPAGVIVLLAGLGVAKRARGWRS